VSAPAATARRGVTRPGREAAGGFVVRRVGAIDWGTVKALLLENIHPEAERILTEKGIEVETRKGALDTGELVEALDGVELLGIRSKTQVTREVFEAHPNLLSVGAFCIGTNQIDLAAATEHAVTCFNAPYSNTRSVVELAVAEIISMARHLTDKNKAMHEGVWDKSAKGAHEVRGRTLGIVGYGNIGSQLSVLAETLGMRVYYYDIVDRLPLGNAQRCETLDELLEKVETVSLHVDGRTGNDNMFGREQFERMRPRSLFLNLCRGMVVDYNALRDALVSGHIAGASVDVFPNEPKSTGDPFSSVLQGLPNVILTPHIGGSTEEAQVDIGRFVAGKLASFVSSGSTTLSVNMPQVQLDSAVNGTRLLHLHRNVPGVLATVNSVLGDHGINIDRQQLSTRGDTGYLVTDAANSGSPDIIQEVIREILELPETIRLSTIN
jgi:D-3-phosphoglycerate dehydrogenase